jgi:hypothetical protein
MSNIVKLYDCECRGRSLRPAVKAGIDEFQSLIESWCSITLSFEQLQDYLDDLGPILDALPDSAGKSDAGLLMTETEIQVRGGLTRSGQSRRRRAR